jgi:von Willebrand factor type A domain
MRAERANFRSSAILRRAGLVRWLITASLAAGCGSRTGIAPDGIFDTFPGVESFDAGLDADASLEADAPPGPDDSIDPCGLVRVGFDQLRPIVILLVDQSGSMNDHFPTRTSPDTRWSVVRNALMDPDHGAVKQLESSVRFGVTFFTSRGGFRGGACPMLTDVASATDNYDAIRALYDRTQPDRDTPTGESIAKVAERLLGVSGPGQKFILLVTDGAPDTCAMPNGNQNQAQAIAVSAAQDAFKNRITLFILGVSSDIEGTNLQQLANAGQGKPINRKWGIDSDAAEPYRASDNVADLSNQIIDILNHVPFCDIRLRRDIDPDTASQGEVILDGKKLVLDDADGWRLNDSRNLEIVGKACETARARGKELVLKFLCEKDAAPDGPDGSSEASTDAPRDAPPEGDASRDQGAADAD